MSRTRNILAGRGAGGGGSCMQGSTHAPKHVPKYYPFQVLFASRSPPQLASTLRDGIFSCGIQSHDISGYVSLKSLNQRRMRTGLIQDLQLPPDSL